MNIRNIYISFSIVTMFLMMPMSVALAGSATVSWTANTESDLTSYKVYYGTVSRSGSSPATCGLCGYSAFVTVLKPQTSYTFASLTGGQTYYFSVTAVDTSNNESAFSTQVSKLIPNTITSDFNSDGLVNSVDLGIMMSQWGQSTKPKSDLNQDGAVNSVDLGILMSQWKTS